MSNTQLNNAEVKRRRASRVFWLVAALGPALLTARALGEDPLRISRPQGPCDVYAAGGNPCVAAHSTTRALYAAYDGPLYKVLRESDRKTLNIGVIRPSSGITVGGYADAGAQDAFCANTVCWITTIYDQSPRHNDLTQAPRGAFAGPALGGFDNLPLADAAPITLMGQKVYGVMILPGMGLRNNNPKGTAVDDQAEGQYWVIDGHHFNSGCCFDYGNAEIDSRDDDNGTMEATYFGNSTGWYHGTQPGPWAMTDQENNLIGCVNDDDSKLCTTLPSLTSRFVTAMAKGAPHRWASLAGNAQSGELTMIYDGRRVDATYDPMRKQGAILLGNGGDNSNSSQGTFYEGAMTAPGTFPTDATDQRVQANVVAAHYDVEQLRVVPAGAEHRPPGLQTFTPGATQETVVQFTNTTGAPVKDLRLGLRVPADGWAAKTDGGRSTKAFAETIAPGQSVQAMFKVTSGKATLQGELTGTATWSDTRQAGTATERVRNTHPVKINEFRIDTGEQNQTNSFVELYNAGKVPVDLSQWTLTNRPTHQAITAVAEIPDGTRLAAGGFYLLGLADSGLAIPAIAGDAVLYVRNTTGMRAGDEIRIGAGRQTEIRRIHMVGSPAADATTVWQPLPEGPLISVPAGSTNLPVQSTDGFRVGQKIALGFGSKFPVTGMGQERFEVASVTAVGKPGSQLYLATQARAGSTSLKVNSVDDISAGDTIRLDIDSLGHGIETVTVRHVGTPAHSTALRASASVGESSINVYRSDRIAIGDQLLVGAPGKLETVRVTGLKTDNIVQFTPALTYFHAREEAVAVPGTGLDLMAPLRFTHAANLPFSDRGTGVSFAPASAFVHATNEPVQGLGTGITLDRPLAKNHPMQAPIVDAAVQIAGYQGSRAPDLWIGGPELTTRLSSPGQVVPVRAGSLALKDAAGTIADSVNYGGVVDPALAEGFQSLSGTDRDGCYAPAPDIGVSTGRKVDGKDTDSNCDDFITAASATLLSDLSAGSKILIAGNASSFHSGQQVFIGDGRNQERGIVAKVIPDTVTNLITLAVAGDTTLTVNSLSGFFKGQHVVIDEGAHAESVVVSELNSTQPQKLTLVGAIQEAHASGTPIIGDALVLDMPTRRSHVRGSTIVANRATPGGPNKYDIAE